MIKMCLLLRRAIESDLAVLARATQNNKERGG